MFDRESVWVWGCRMELGKLRYGFLQVDTLAGQRSVKPTFFERLRLVWTFRNFSILSAPVLTAREQRLVASLCSPERMIQCWEPNERERAELIGTLTGVGAQRPA